MDISSINTAEEARDFVQVWQYNFDMHNYSYEELVEWQSFFEELVERFPELYNEFKENGII